MNTLLAEIEQTLKKILDTQNSPALSLKKAMNYAVFSGGKRIRALLTRMIADVLNLPTFMGNYLGCSIELIHCYSLIQDDLPCMDNDDFRRGQPSCHKAFDEATALLASDGLHLLAFEIIHDLHPHLEMQTLLSIQKQLFAAAGIQGMLGGQALDIQPFKDSDWNIEDLNQIHRLKTGAIMRSCVELPLIAHGKVDSNIKLALNDFIDHLGLVFQIQDDYLDRYQTLTESGKKKHSDDANNKLTYTYFYKQSEHLKVIEHHFDAISTALLTLQQHTSANMSSKIQNLSDFTLQLKQRTHPI